MCCSTLLVVAELVLVLFLLAVSPPFLCVRPHADADAVEPFSSCGVPATVTTLTPCVDATGGLDEALGRKQPAFVL